MRRRSPKKVARQPLTTGRHLPPSKALLKRLVEEAILDAYGDAEQRTGFLCALENHLALPFETSVLGVTVAVEKIDITEAGEIVAICRRGRQHLSISILELPLPARRPPGAEWIEAYRLWVRAS